MHLLVSKGFSIQEQWSLSSLIYFSTPPAYTAPKKESLVRYYGLTSHCSGMKIFVRAYLEKNSAWMLRLLEFVPDLTSMLVCSGFTRCAVLIIFPQPLIVSS